jgi:hypothetical protein
MPSFDLYRRLLLEGVGVSKTATQQSNEPTLQTVNLCGFRPGTWEYLILRLCWRIEEVRILILYEDLPDVHQIFEEFSNDMQALPEQRAQIQNAHTAYLQARQIIDQVLDAISEPFVVSLLETLRTAGKCEDPLFTLLEKLHQKQSSSNQHTTEEKNGCDEQKTQRREEASESRMLVASVASTKGSR